MPTLYPLPTVINPDDKLCVVLKIPNEINHIGAFLGAIYNLTRWYSWARDDNKTGKNVAQVWMNIYDDLVLLLGKQSCDGGSFPMLRQNPNSPCQMQYQDNFGNWVTFFDFGACSLFGTNLEIQGLLEYSETNIALTTTNTEIGIYNQNPSSYEPQTQVNNLATANRDTLLCYAIREIVTVYLETIARNKEEAERNNITLSMIVGTVVAVGFAPLNPIVIGSILASFALGYTVAIQSVSQAELRDATAIDKLLCHIYFQLEGDVLSRAGWQATIASNPFNSGTPEYKMVEVLKPIFATTESYLAIVNHMKANLASVSALVNECLNCGDDIEWSHEFDFTVSSHGAWWTPQTFNVSQMAWLTGQGWRNGVNIPSSSMRYIVDYLRLVTTPQNFYCMGYDVYYTFVATTVGDNIETRIQWFYQLDGVQSALTETDIPATSHTDVVYKSVERIIDRVLFQIVGGRRAGASPNGSIVISKIVIHGKGYNPFA